jgi:hypothetical protein
MTIQINTDKNVTGESRTEEYFSGQVTKELDRFAEHVTRVEVFFADENGEKSSPNDKRCRIEARMEGRQPIAVTAKDDVIEKAFNSALGKVKASMNTIVGKMQEKR